MKDIWSDPVPGHIDWLTVIQSERTAFVVDYKFGRMEVEHATANTQLRTYVTMVRDEYPDIDTVHACIIQPLNENDFHSVKYTTEHFESLKQWFFNVMLDAQAEDAPRNPSLEACRFCKARAYCKEAQATLRDLVNQEANAVPVDELEAMWPEVQLARNVAAGIEARLKDIAEQVPEALRTLQLGKGKQQRMITDPVRAYSELMISGLLGDNPMEASNALLACSKISVSKLSKHVAKQRGIKEWEARELLIEQLGEIFLETTQKPSLEKKR